MNFQVVDETLPVSSSAVDTAYELTARVTIKIFTPQHDVSKLFDFPSRMTVGEAADQAARELGIFAAYPTFLDPNGYLHRRESGMVSMLSGEQVQLINID